MRCLRKPKCTGQRWINLPKKSGYGLKHILLICLLLMFSSRTLATCKHILNEVENGSVCTKIKTHKSADLTDTPILLIALHGDSPFNNPSYQYVFAKKIAEQSTNLIAVGMLRPGYTDTMQRTSSGRKGNAVGDNYDETRVEQIATAVTKLATIYNPSKIILAGHSGGAAITANLIALYPDLVDHAVIVSCPCNVPKWRKDMFALTSETIFQKPIEHLSPADVVTEIAQDTKVSMFIGDNDKVTKSYLSKEYQSLLTKAGIEASLTQTKGGHDIFLDDQVMMAVVDIIHNYNKTLQ